MKRTVAVLALLFTLSLIALGHGNEKHVMGTVTSISDNSITVETTSKKAVTVSVSSSTKFQKSGSPVTLKDLKVGDKVVIHATGSEDKLVATEIRFGPMNKDDMSGMKSMDHTHASDSAPENH
jgi:preprotein translocase subunit YajC